MASNPIPRYLQEKRANFHELFYDLIFVYALQKIAHVLLHTEKNGILSLNTFVVYILMSLFLWLLWTHQTVFTNRFGELSPKDVAFTIVNIFLLVFLSNSFYPDFNKTFVPFMTYMSLLYLSISIQYLLHIPYTQSKSDKMTCITSGLVALIVAVFSIIGLVTPPPYRFVPGNIGLFIAAVGWVPFRKYLVESPVNMMHLVERYSLLTIIVFGELLVGIAGIFNINKFDYLYIFQFMILIGLFLTYWAVTEFYINHYHRTVGFKLSYSHLIINIALGGVNAAIVFSCSDKINRLFEVNLMYGSILLFFIGLWLNISYFHDYYKNMRLIIAPFLLIITGYILSLLFVSYDDVLVITSAIVNSTIALIYYTNKRKLKRVDIASHHH